MNNATTKSEPAASQPMWTIRTDKGKTFGPASLDTLRSWARDGRVAPTSEVSQNDSDWTPVTTLPLEMDWVVEVAPATFYGPIHRSALEELIRDGSLTKGIPHFQRISANQNGTATMAAAAKAAAAAQRAAEARADELQKRLAEAQRKLDQAQANLKARDHEFEAERQELKAAHSRAQAEVVKIGGRLATLEAENASLIDSTRLAREAQEQSAAATQQAAELEQKLAEAQERENSLRLMLRQVEESEAALRNQLEHSHNEREQLNKRLLARQQQTDQARQLSQQLLTALTHENEPEIEDAVVVVEPSTIPPVAAPAGKRAASSLSLAAIEQQAQRELQQIGNNGGTIFKRQSRK